MIGFKKVGEIIQLSDREAIHGWLEDNSVSVIRTKKGIRVDLNELIISILVIQAKQMKANKGKDWKDFFRLICPDLILSDRIIKLVDSSSSNNNNMTFNKKNDANVKLYESLIS